MNLYDKNISLYGDSFESISLKATHTISLNDCSIKDIESLEAHSIFLNNIKDLKEIKNIKCENLTIKNCTDIDKISALDVDNRLRVYNSSLSKAGFLRARHIELEELHQLQSIDSIESILINILGCPNLESINSIQSKSLDISDKLPKINKLKTQGMTLNYLNAIIDPSWEIQFQIHANEVVVYDNGGKVILGTYSRKENSKIIDL